MAIHAEAIHAKAIHAKATHATAMHANTLHETASERARELSIGVAEAHRRALLRVSHAVPSDAQERKNSDDPEVLALDENQVAVGLQSPRNR